MSTIWTRLVNLGGLITGTLPIANGGTGQVAKTAAFDALSPLTTRGDVIFRDASNNVRLGLGTHGKFLRADSNDPFWEWVDTTSPKSADYTVTDTDSLTVVLMTTAGTDRTVTLPTVADNLNRAIVIKKVDSGTGRVIVDGEGSETINGLTSLTLVSQYDWVRVVSDGTSWHTMGGVIREYLHNSATATNADDTSSFAYGSGGQSIKAFSVAVVRRVRALNAITERDSIQLEVARGAGGPFLPFTGTTEPGAGMSFLQIQNTNYYGLGFKHTTSGGINSTDLDVFFGNYAYANGATYGAAGVAWSSFTGFFWRISKITHL